MVVPEFCIAGVILTEDALETPVCSHNETLDPYVLTDTPLFAVVNDTTAVGNDQAATETVDE